MTYMVNAHANATRAAIASEAVREQLGAESKTEG